MPAVDVSTPSDPAFAADPYPAYRVLRDGPRVVHHEPTDTWLVARHADVDALLRDRRLGRTYLHVATHAEMGRPDDPPPHAPFWRVVRAGMLDVEPPDHTRLRRLVSRAFTPRTVERLRDTVQRITDSLVDDIQGAGEVDLLSTVAEPLPATVIAEMLGVEELLRFDTPLQMFERWVLQDVDVGRVIDPHLSFGAGVHFCLGAALARLELQTSFGTVLRRLPHLELVEEPTWRPGYVIRGVDQLRVRA